MKRNTAELKERLIQTGFEEIKNKGIDQLSLRTVARKCGVTHGTPYRHFDSKDGYLKVVLARISDLCNEILTENVDPDMIARESLFQMGVSFITFSMIYPNFFEALFLKYPFNYLRVNEETISTTINLPGFNHFKEIVLALIKEEGLNVSEIDAIFQLWSYITGLAILANGPSHLIPSEGIIKENLKHMISIYIKGGQL